MRMNQCGVKCDGRKCHLGVLQCTERSALTLAAWLEISLSQSSTTTQNNKLALGGSKSTNALS